MKKNEDLTAAVARLLTDRRLRARFRRDPERAVERFGLSRAELQALKRGRADELLGLGLDPAVVHPEGAVSAPLQAWLLRNAKRVAPGVVLAALLAAWPATARAVGDGPTIIPGMGHQVICEHEANTHPVQARTRGFPVAKDATDKVLD